jgi:predicted ATPase
VLLAAVHHAAFVAQAIAEALELSDATSIDLPRRARAACEDPTLILLDNCEQVLDAAALVADLLTSIPTLRLLATSRAPFRMRGEREYAVGPLEVEAASDPNSSGEHSPSPAVRLLLERIREVQPAFQLTPQNSEAVAAICRRLDALPLALELAAPWIKVLTVDDLLRRLSADALLSTMGPRDLPERQQTMNATVAWSYQLLDADDQRVFRRLGTLPGRFPIDAAAAVLSGTEPNSSAIDAALAGVAGLVDRSLLVRAESSVATRPLFAMLETIRAFAALRLAASGERDAALDGLSRYCIEQSFLAGDGLTGLEQAAWLDRVRDDLDSYRGALVWLIERGRASAAADIVWHLLFFWLIRGHATEALRWCEQILSASSLPAEAETRVRTCAAILSFAQGDHARARTLVARVRSLTAGGDDEAIAVLAENLVGHVELAEGDLGAARRQFQRSSDGFRALSSPWGLGNALGGLAACALAVGDVAETERLLNEAETVLQHSGPWFLGMALYVRAHLAVRRGDADEAFRLGRRNLLSIRELHDKFALVYALGPLAAAAVLDGDDAWAARISGARDAVTAGTGGTAADSSADDLRRIVEEARARLGPDRWDRAHAAGRALSIDALLEEIDARERLA